MRERLHVGGVEIAEVSWREEKTEGERGEH